MTKPATSSQSVGVISSSIELLNDDGSVKKRVQLLPFGEYYGRDGRGPYVLEGAGHARSVIAATLAFQGRQDFLFNYDHQSEYSAVQGVGGRAEAAGWAPITSLEVGDDGIYGTVDWTESAEAALAAKHYRYHSPHFRVDPKTRRVTRLVNAGLTNSPNLDLPALASQQSDASQEEGNSMNKFVSLLSSTAIAALALTAESSDEDVLASIDQLVSDNTETEAALASVQAKLGLGDDADTEAVLASIDSAKTAGKPDPAKFVPIDALTQVQGQLKDIQDERVLACVDEAIVKGKLPPAQKDWAIEYGQKDMPALQSYLGNQPTFKGRAQIEGDPPKSDTSKLTADEAAICSTMGWDEDEFLEQKKKEQA